MAYSTQAAVSDGTLKTLSLSIDYLDRSDIYVYLGGIPATLGADWAWVGTTDKIITFTNVLPAGTKVLVKRITSSRRLYHSFAAGSQFTAKSLDEALDQTLYLSQEFSESTGIASDDLPRPVGSQASPGVSMQYARADHVHVGMTGGSVGSVAMDTFVGDGSRLSFTLANTPVYKSTTQVFIDSVYQSKAVYSLTSNVLTFDEAPALGANIEVITLTIGGGKASDVQVPDTVDLPVASTGGNTQGALTWLAQLMSFVQYGAGAIKRTVASKLRERLSVLDFGAVGDGVADDTAAVQAALNRAVAYGIPLYWPSGTYKVTASLSSLHDVANEGPGIINRGGYTFYISPNSTSQVNTLHVTPLAAGNDAYDGLTPDCAFANPQRAADLLQFTPLLRKLSTGAWKVRLMAGTFTSGLVWSRSVTTSYYVDFYGDVDGSNNPLTLFDGTSSSATAALYFDSGPSNLMVRNMKASNYRANSVASGFVFANRGIAKLYTVNLWSYNNLWAGINVDSIGQFLCETGTHDSNTNYGIRVRGGVEISIGYNGTATTNRVVLKNSACGSQVRDASTGHFDWVDIINCPTGVWTTNVSRTTQTGLALNNVNLGFRTDGGSVFGYDATTTFTSVANKFQLAGGGSHDMADGTGQGLCYDAFNNRWYTGVDQWGGSMFSTTAHAWGSNKTTNAGFAYLVPDSTTAQIMFGSKSVPTAMRLDAVIPSYQFKYVANNAVVAAIDAASINPWRDNVASCGLAASRFTQLYAATATVNTSDERTKTDIGPIDPALLRAWEKVEFYQYRFKDAVARKGDGARLHLGVVAQRVKEAFESEGIDPFAYGILCYDKWDAVADEYDEQGNLMTRGREAGELYGVRYEEAMILECALLRSKLNN